MTDHIRSESSAVLPMVQEQGLAGLSLEQVIWMPPHVSIHMLALGREDQTDFLTSKLQFGCDPEAHLAQMLQR